IVRNRMHLSRRNFLRSVSVGAAAATSMRLPLPAWSSATVFEPVRRREPGGPIHLDNNENVYGRSAKTAPAIRATLGSVNRYPFQEYDALVEQIANLHSIKHEEIMLGCRSTELLCLAPPALLR